jgi:hypothetical protein
MCDNRSHSNPIAFPEQQEVGDRADGKGCHKLTINESRCVGSDFAATDIGVYPL